MQRIAIIGTLALLGVALATPLGSADHCNGIITEIPLGSETMYVDDRTASSGNPNHVYIYLESNSVKGLQTGGYGVLGGPFSPTPWFVIDSCDHDNPDLLIWSPELIF